MRLFNKVAIIGTGLIGGSLGLAIKKEKLAALVVGVSRRRKNLTFARKTNAIDRGSQELKIIRGADLVIFATPVNAILRLAPEVAKLIGPQTIVSDVGSTKQEIVSALTKIFPRFVGAHPLAGSEKRGMLNAKINLFKGSLCILTPQKNTDHRALGKIKKLWSAVGAKVIFLTPQNHDAALSFVSHLPHIAAFSLINSIPVCYLKFAPNSLKDTTRIAASDILLWQDIFLSNKKNSLKAIEVFQKNLSRIKSAILHGNREMLLRILASGKSRRENLK